MTIALAGDLRVRGGQGSRWWRQNGVIVAPDRTHQVSGEGRLAQLYVDPEDAGGRSLLSALGGNDLLALSGRRVVGLRRVLTTAWRDDWDIDGWRRCAAEIVGELGAAQAPAPSPDPRVARIMDLLRASPAARRSITELSSLVSLSESRIAHLFRSEVGIPVRRYVLWLRLIRAIDRLAADADLTTAAHDAGFSDSAHLARTFRRMFGVPPSFLSDVRKFGVGPVLIFEETDPLGSLPPTTS